MTPNDFIFWLKGLLELRNDVPVELIKRELEKVITPNQVKYTPGDVTKLLNEYRKANNSQPTIYCNDSPYQGGIEKRYVVETNSYDS